MIQIMKKIKLSIFSIIALLSVSCTDILDRNPSDQLADGTMWTSEALTAQGVDAIYQAMRLPLSSKTGENGNLIVGETKDLGYYGWEVFGMTGQTRLAAGNVFSASANASNLNFSSTWSWCFNGINRANDAIVNLPSAQVTSTSRAKYLAEAKTLRAFFYMRLNELFGRGIGVPIYEYVINLNNNNKTQSPEIEVWDFIIKDLTDAIDTPEFPNNAIDGAKATGRVSKGAAYALRGKAYLMKSMSLNLDFYQNAMDDFEKVESMGYGLFAGNYADLFTVANEGCNEMILSIQNIENPKNDKYGSAIQKYAAPWNAGAAAGGSCWTDLQLTPAIADLYEVKVDNSTVKPFDWEDIVPGYSSMPYDGRKVFFVRDIRLNGQEIQNTVTSTVNGILSGIPSPYKSYYLAEGNEARITKAYANRDPRLAASIITPYSEFVGLNASSPTGPATLVSRWPVTGKFFPDTKGSETQSANIPGMKTSLVANGQNYFYYMFRKFIGTGTTYADRSYAPIDEPIIRFADVLLMWAEAAVEKGDLAKAQELVSRVRDRVNMPTMASYFANKDIARDYVRDERRRELVGEGVNFFDEMRWKTLQKTKFEYGPKTAMQVWGGPSTGATSYSWTEKWYTWPVPRTEVERNPNLKRTPGWSY